MNDKLGWGPRIGWGSPDGGVSPGAGWDMFDDDTDWDDLEDITWEELDA